MLISEPLPPANRTFLHVHHLVEVSADGRRKSRVLEVLERLDADEQADLYSRFEKLDDAPFFREPMWRSMGEWFKSIGECWEVGNDGRVRFYGFRDRDRLVLAVGCKKRGKETPRDVTAECKRLEAEFKATQARGRR